MSAPIQVYTTLWNETNARNESVDGWRCKTTDDDLASGL